MRVMIVGGPMTGKSTEAERLRASMGLECYLCTDTVSQAGGRAPGKPLHAPAQFDKDWHGLSLWVSENWLTKSGPWILEGVAAVRALRKYHLANPVAPPPVDRVIWMNQERGALSNGQAAMTSGHSTMMDGLIDSWPELYGIVRMG